MSIPPVPNKENIPSQDISLVPPNMTFLTNTSSQRKSESSSKNEFKNELKPIAEHIEKIKKLRKGLLDSVKGQRHAVNEMVEPYSNAQYFRLKTSAEKVLLPPFSLQDLPA